MEILGHEDRRLAMLRAGHRLPDLALGLHLHPLATSAPWTVQVWVLGLEE